MFTPPGPHGVETKTQTHFALQVHAAEKENATLSSQVAKLNNLVKDLNSSASQARVNHTQLKAQVCGVALNAHMIEDSSFIRLNISHYLKLQTVY